MCDAVQKSFAQTGMSGLNVESSSARSFGSSSYRSQPLYLSCQARTVYSDGHSVTRSATTAMRSPWRFSTAPSIAVSNRQQRSFSLTMRNAPSALPLPLSLCQRCPQARDRIENLSTPAHNATRAACGAEDSEKGCDVTLHVWEHCVCRWIA
jgi:hypothetical protein